MPDERRGSVRLAAGATAAVVLLAGAAAAFVYLGRYPGLEPPPVTPSDADITPQLHKFCGACHLSPPPDTFPNYTWKDQVERMYVFAGQSGLALRPPPIEAAIRWYRDRAPPELPPVNPERAAGPPPLRFERTDILPLEDAFPPAISHVSLVRLSDPQRPEVLACEMRWGLILSLDPSAPSPAWKVLGKARNPAHVEVVDLDGDGIKDLLVADLGNFLPTDRRNGSVVWLRGTPSGKFEPVTLLDNVGRVADVQAADFNGDGKLDLVVASFGWQHIGELLYLENQTTDWARPKFVPRVLDERHGTIHVPIADLNGDGRPDFVALISQEHETVVAFLNQGGGKFEREIIYTAPHPGYGSSGIELTDLDGDGDLDVLYTNGDVLDKPYLLKPYHSVQWLENRGRFPFEHHPITPLYGVHRAVAADLLGTGHKDILAVSFLPPEAFPQRMGLNLDAVLLLERTAPGRFARHSLEKGTCDYTTCVVGDLYGSGRQDLVIGHFTLDKGTPALTIWKNLGRRTEK